jgi:hypothetical protein
MAGRLSLENCVKMIEINRKSIFSGGYTDQPPAFPGHQIASRDIFLAKGRGGVSKGEEGYLLGCATKGICLAAPPKES